MLVVIYLLVKLNEAQRVITINYAKRVHGNSSYGGIKSILPIKLIAAGVVPVIFATAFLSLPALIGQVITSFDAGNEESEDSYRKTLKAAGFVKRDPRVKERKKYGLKKARRAPQFSKR